MSGPSGRYRSRFRICVGQEERFINNSRQRPCVRMISFGISCALLIACSGALAAKTQTDVVVKVARLNRAFKLKVGERAMLKGTQLRIKFLAVESDSRCPKDVTCVWAGNAAVSLHLSTRTGNITITRNTSTSPQFVTDSEDRGFRVKLVRLRPYPRSKRKIAASDYIATLLVSKE